MQSKSYLFLSLVVALGIIAGVLFKTTPVQYGLDVKGGVRLIYQIDDSKVTQEQRNQMATIRPNIRRILDGRVHQALAVAEGDVIMKDPDQFVVELPGFTDIKKAEETLGTSASIKFYWAKNVKTDLANYRPYSIGERATSGNGGIAVTFIDSTQKEISYDKNPAEYKKIIEGWELELQGDDLAKASAEPTGQSGYRPVMTFSSAGAAKMEKFTRMVENRGENLATVLDGVVLSINPIEKNTILKDNAVIQGSYSAAYVKSLTDMLNSGALPVDLKPIGQELVDPVIGEDALTQIMKAGGIAFGVISLFLIVYYALPGFMAFIALSLYVLFTVTILKLIGATFSLAAIAGFVLSVGMAVDANILVFERFKEELKAGRSLVSALELGFRRALPAIIDSNMCTILTSIVLVSLGTGPVKGFATTLIMGVAISLFTAVVVTRSLLMFCVGSGLASNPKVYAVERGWFGEKFEAKAQHEPLKIVENWKKWFFISLATIVPGVIFIALGGIKPNVEFRGGYEVSYKVNQVNASQISDALEKAGLRGGNVKVAHVKGDTLALVSLPPLKQLEVPQDQAIKVISDASGLPASAVSSFSQIGAAIQKETLTNAILGVIVSSALIVVYLALRFGFAVGGFIGGVRFGASAIGALLHDILVVAGVAAIMGYFLNWDVSSLSITAMLTIIGFSVHDTIVIFDRIREHLRRPNKDEDFGHLVDRSITQSFARSINTSMTVVVTLLILIVAGTATIDLKFFCLAMLVGIVSGTYSSIYNASPILYLWEKSVERRKGKAATLIGMALEEAARRKFLTPTAGPTSPAAPTPGAPAATTTTTPSGRTYGQVKRRANDQSKGRIPLDDDLP